jgi:urease accessory protein
MTSRNRLPHAAFALTLMAIWVATAAPAGAHTGHELGGAWAGLLHPVLGIDHLIAMVATGVLAFVLDRDVRIPAAFLGAMTLGGAVGLLGVTSPIVEWAVTLAVVALGFAVIAGAAIGRNAALALVAVAGAMHGWAHGLEVPSAAMPVLYVAGFLAATAALLAAGWSAGVLVARSVTIRATAGAAVAGAGLGLLLNLA